MMSRVFLSQSHTSVLTVRLNMAAGLGMWIGSGSRSPSSFFHRIRTRLAGWETLSASFRTANERQQVMTTHEDEVRHRLDLVLSPHAPTQTYCRSHDSAGITVQHTELKSGVSLTTVIITFIDILDYSRKQTWRLCVGMLLRSWLRYVILAVSLALKTGNGWIGSICRE